MTDTIRVAAMLIEDGIPVPESLIFDTKAYSPGWLSITNSSSAQLGREIENAGWTLFYMAGEIRTRGFGFNDQSRGPRSDSGRGLTPISPLVTTGARFSSPRAARGAR
jgi:hypothetical protein